MLKEIRYQSMGDLSIEHKVTDQVVLADESRGILAKVMEDLHHLIRFQNLFKAMMTRIHSS